ncbi:CocE/NonD family hydrolase C-terminal non-catalytic domain-containing protein [Streptomyces sp. NPDC056161]|uniref:CocE/NonD family hydrolase C-terminal non-catalytic domain-containing protein n=1 Tax=Streptomyces sp. NPDC056161 TaxID=3345732 RepID=UPI0035E2EDDC
MTTEDGEPIASVTDATLADIAANGIWRDGGLDINPSVLAVARALLAAVQGTAPAGTLPEELQELVARVLRQAGITFPRVSVTEEIGLSAFAIKQNASERRPVVIVPAGWNPYGWLPFMVGYLSLAARGYHVLAYTPRGIGKPDLPYTSEGFINVAGSDDWADGSRVIDHAQELFAPSKVGFMGLSYGSGISQLVAAHDQDNRVAAVAALSTWGNLATSLYDNGTRHLEAVQTLIDFTGGTEEEKFDEETRRILQDFRDGRNLEDVVAWGTERSPETYVGCTNARGIPTFYSNTWHESLFPVGEAIAAFEQITAPKHLNLWIGDHGAPEGAGITGLATGTPFPGLLTPMQEAYAWLDHYLLGRANEVPDWPVVNSQVMFTYKTVPAVIGRRITVPARREPLPSWSEATTDSEAWYLSGNGGNGDGTLSDKPSTGWSRAFAAGHETAATAMDEIMTTGQKEWFGNPKNYKPADFERTRLLLWSTEALTGGRRIRGAATVRLAVRSDEADAATLVAYLFDIAPDNSTRIITHEPFTATGLRPGTDRTVSWTLQPTAYDLPDGHRLALVVNSHDKLYAFTGKKDSTTTITSLIEEEAVLELPLG